MPKFWKPIKLLKGKLVEFSWRDVIDPQYLGTETPSSTKVLTGDGKWTESSLLTTQSQGSNGYFPQGW